MTRVRAPYPLMTTSTGGRGPMKSNKLKIAVGVVLAFVMALPVVY